MKTCEKCKTPLVRDEHHDAYYCPACREWKESKCSDAKCGFCRERPKRPVVRA